jgi:serine/threonine-protein kinase RsbW
MSDVLKFSIPGKPEYVQMVRLAIASIAGKANFNVDAVEDIKEAVAEACKIVFCHGCLGLSDRYEIICEVEDEKITITASDACSESKHTEGARCCNKCADEGNLAVPVMESLMDSASVEFDEGGNKIIKMVKKK